MILLKIDLHVQVWNVSFQTQVQHKCSWSGTCLASRNQSRHEGREHVVLNSVWLFHGARWIDHMLVSTTLCKFCVCESYLIKSSSWNISNGDLHNLSLNWCSLLLPARVQEPLGCACVWATQGSCGAAGAGGGTAPTCHQFLVSVFAAETPEEGLFSEEPCLTGCAGGSVSTSAVSQTDE